jgi:hypothetical protein
VRLEMRRVAGLAVAVPLLLGSYSCCSHCVPHTLAGDVVSGAPKGSPLVKVLVTLADVDGKCKANVDPERVVVFRGSAIRWLVDNKCKSPAVSYLQFTRPTPKASREDGEPKPQPWDYRFCTGRIASLGAEKERNVLFCEVPETVVPGVYKYGLEGAAQKDPDIEVRRGPK